MTVESFRDSLSQVTPPAGLTEALTAMWHAGKKDWDASHDIAQDIPTRTGDWIHAYLHRWEGDDWNARYWYRRAGKEVPAYDLNKEWEVIVTALLGKTSEVF